MKKAPHRGAFRKKSDLFDIPTHGWGPISGRANARLSPLRSYVDDAILMLVDGSVNKHPLH